MTWDIALNFIANNFSIVIVGFLLVYITSDKSLPFIDKLVFSGNMGWGKKGILKLEIFSEDNSLTHLFGRSFVVDDEDMLLDSLNAELLSCQKIGRKLILNLEASKVINSETMHALRNAIDETIDMKKTRLEVTFPEEFADSEIEYIAQGLYEKSKSSLIVDVHRGYKRRSNDG